MTEAETVEDDGRARHLAWCKERALEYVKRGDLVNALASMASDVRQHPGTDTRAMTVPLAMEGPRCVAANDQAGMRRLIEGFH
jgi:hypothetical protein